MVAASQAKLGFPAAKGYRYGALGRTGNPDTADVVFKGMHSAEHRGTEGFKAFDKQMQAHGWTPQHDAGHPETAAWSHPQHGTVSMETDLPPLVSGPMRLTAGGVQARVMDYTAAAKQASLLEHGKPLDPGLFRKAVKYPKMSLRQTRLVERRAALGEKVTGGLADEPRDERGRWTFGGMARGRTTAGGGAIQFLHG
jgi:hypothetical protein